ncbi:helix-turn-helix transcriptional regulator, partial [Acinetobacter sp. ULE_I053]|uniref:helix-turn-helix transcriptional regulator n=1 Tax=Acinetobacter sp. ULE_I053 TaxID=3373069 RepID=UPI003AF7BD02
IIDDMDHNKQMLYLEDLSQSLGISRYAIIRLFKNNFGLTPHEYQLNQKINIARNRLKYGESIIQVANDLGFTDQSHFNNLFK